MKKSISILGLLALLVSFAIAPPRADAVVGIAEGQMELVAIGVFLITGGNTIISEAENAGYINANTGRDNFDNFVFHALGWVLLDQGGTLTPAFGPLNPGDAAALKISPTELENYNQELDEINSITEAISAKLSVESAPTIAESRALWWEYKDDISPEALSAVQKIAGQMFVQ